MIIMPIKTHKITKKDRDLFSSKTRKQTCLFAILDKYLPPLQEKSIVAITSKIISITEGRIVKIGSVDKDELIEKEAQFYLPRNENPYNVSLTITGGTLVATAGIDESNGNGYYILWPKNAQKTANAIRLYLKKVRGVREIGVIITDSRTTPLRWGVTGFTLVYSGFSPLKNYIGKPDLFGRKFKFEQMSIIDNLASSAAVVMGEGREQTPMAVIEDVPFVEFQKRNPTKKELEELKIKIEEDLYGPLLKSVNWRKGSAEQNSNA